MHNPPLNQRSVPWPEHKLAPTAHSATSSLLVPLPRELIPMKIAARTTNTCVRKKSTCSPQSQFSYWTSDNPRLRKQKAKMNLGQGAISVRLKKKRQIARL